MYQAFRRVPQSESFERSCALPDTPFARTSEPLRVKERPPAERRLECRVKENELGIEGGADLRCSVDDRLTARVGNRERCKNRT